MANRGYEYYIPPNLRAPLREAGGIGYQLLDNLIGFRDNYDTTGERLGRGLRENPVGTLGGVASGAWEGIKGAVMHPIDTARGVVSGVQDAYFGAVAPLPGSPTREELGQRLTDLSILGGLVPAGKGLMSLLRPGVVGAADEVVPPAPVLSMEDLDLVDVEDVYDRLDDFVPALSMEEQIAAALRAREAEGPVDIVQPPDFFDDLQIQWEPEPEPEPNWADDNLLNQIVNEFEALPSSPRVEQTGLVSTLGRAAINLEQPRYGSYDEVLANLRRLGAKDQEISQSGIMSLRDVKGPITKDMVEAAVAADNPLQVARYGAGSDAPAEYQAYFTPGGENYREVVISQPTRPGQNAYVSPSHFLDAGDNQLVHYRAAEFPISEFALNGEQARAFHIGEIQSDWAQRNRAVAAEKRIADLPPDEVPAWYKENIDDPRREFEAAQQRLGDLQARINYDDNLIAGRRNDPDARLSVAERLDIENEIAALEDKLPVLHAEREDTHGLAAAFYRYWERYASDDGLEWQYSRTDRTVPGIIEHPVGGTNQVTTLALRQALADAARTDTDFVTVGSGQMSYDATFGKLDGQQEYYDNIVPKQMRDLLKKLGRQYGIDAPELEPIVLFGQSSDGLEPHNVVGFRMTPELREAILNDGMDMFRDGGMVYR